MEHNVLKKSPLEPFWIVFEILIQFASLSVIRELMFFSKNIDILKDFGFKDGNTLQVSAALVSETLVIVCVTIFKLMWLFKDSWSCLGISNLKLLISSYHFQDSVDFKKTCKYLQMLCTLKVIEMT